MSGLFDTTRSIEGKPKSVELTPEQRAAVEHQAGPLAVLAGPGTGKTHVLTARVAHMIVERGVQPESIVALTFSNKAARELRERLAALLGLGPAEGVVATTFHAFGLGLVRRFADRAGFARAPMLADSAQERRLLRELVREHALFGRAPGQPVDRAADTARGHIAMLRHAAIDPDRAEAFTDERLMAGGPEGDADAALLADIRDSARLMRAFDAACLERGLLTFDHLVAIPTRLITRDPSVAAFVRASHGHVLVDEYQDVNTQQIELLRALCPPGSRPDLCVVGDDDQAIYAFRGADERAFERFEANWPGARVVELGDNFRSASRIVAAANDVIARAHARFRPDKITRAARADLGTGEVDVVRLDDKDQSGEVIALDLLERKRAGTLNKWSDAAVIARTHPELERVAAALRLEGVPVRRAHDATRDEGVRDVLAWIDLLCDPGASWAARRPLVRPPIGLSRDAADRSERAYRNATSRAQTLGGPGPASFAGFLRDWVPEHIADDDPDRGRIDRFLRTHDELASIAAAARADEAVFETVRRTDAAHADLLTGSARAARVRSLVQLVAFVRSRMGRVEPPGGLQEMRAHVEDMDEKERWGAGRGGLVDGESPDDTSDAGTDEDDAGDAVVLLTAHASKGLEFHTVYVAGVTPRGFPMSRSGSQDPELPEGLIDRLGDERDASARHDDEERRIFYVACTRAERRLVLLGKVSKSKPRLHFLVEQVSGAHARVRDAADIVAASPRRDELERFGAVFAERRDAEARLARAEAQLRARAGDALGRAGDGGDRESASRELTDIAEHAAVLGYVRTQREIPDWVREPALRSYALDLLGDDSERTRVSSGLRAPLELSYSMIDAYRTCPRCFYTSRVLGLGEVENAHLAVGRAVHETLCEHYEAWRAADAEGTSPPGREQLIETAKRRALGGWPAALAFDPGAAQQVQRLVATMWDQLHDDNANIVELERKVVFPYVHGGVEHRFTAKLDRVDQVDMPDGRVVDKIIDYKTGAPTKKLLDSDALRKDMQMGVYVRALREWRGDPELGGVCEYWVLSSGEVGRVSFDEIRHDLIEKWIGQAIDGMLAGDFDKVGCGGAGVCSILGDHPG